MATILALDDEHVRETASGMMAHADVLEQQALRLLVSARSVDWYGPNRELFQYEAEQTARELNAAAEAIRSLAYRAIHSADRWQSVDAWYARAFSLFTLK